jgi:hypothetical protein
MVAIVFLFRKMSTEADQAQPTPLTSVAQMMHGLLALIHAVSTHHKSFPTSGEQTGQ